MLDTGVIRTVLGNTLSNAIRSELSVKKKFQELQLSRYVPDSEGDLGSDGLLNTGSGQRRARSCQFIVLSLYG